MKVANSHVIHADRESVWSLLHDPDVLARTVPGCQSFEPDGENRYAAKLAVGVGPIRGRFSGAVELADGQENEWYTMTLTGQGPTGFVQGEGRVTLSDEESGTRVSVEGDAQIGGTLAQIGSRMIETAVRILMGQFFDSLSKEAEQSGKQ